MSEYSAEEVSKMTRSFPAVPLHRHLGLQFERQPKRRVSFAVTIEQSGGYDYLHGGVVYVALDVASAFELTGRLPRGIQEKTVDLSITLIRSAKVGDTVELFAEIEHVGRTSAVLSVKAYRAADGKLLARASVSKRLIALDKLGEATRLVSAAIDPPGP